MSTESRKLPELPCPFTAMPIAGDDHSLFTADQMHAYAQAALAHSHAQDSGGEAVGGERNARQIAHQLYCEIGQCHGDPVCFNGADAVVQERWINAVQTVLGSHTAAEQPAKVEGCNCGAIAVGDADQRRHHFDCPAYATPQPAAPSAQAASDMEYLLRELREVVSRYSNTPVGHRAGRFLRRRGDILIDLLEERLTTQSGDTPSEIVDVLRLVDGYLSTQIQEKLLAWDGGMMTWGELRQHVQAAIAMLTTQPAGAAVEAVAMIQRVIDNLRAEEHERRQQDESVGIRADNETADMLATEANWLVIAKHRLAESIPPQQLSEQDAIEQVLRDRGYRDALTAEWMAKHLDHYQQVIEAYSRLRGQRSEQVAGGGGVDDAEVERIYQRCQEGGLRILTRARIHAALEEEAALSTRDDGARQCEEDDNG